MKRHRSNLQDRMIIILNKCKFPIFHFISYMSTCTVFITQSQLQAHTLKRGYVKGNLIMFATYLNMLPVSLSHRTLEQLEHRISIGKLLLTQYV